MKTLLFLLAATAAFATQKPLKHPELPEDMGPAAIDVSDYPAEQRETYEKILLPLYGFLRGGPARALNSPLIELDEGAAAALRRKHPELFADARLATVGADVWRQEVMAVKNRPPCCGACPIVSMEDAKKLWSFFVYDSVRRKTGANASAWARQRRSLIEKLEAYQKEHAGSEEKPK